MSEKCRKVYWIDIAIAIDISKRKINLERNVIQCVDNNLTGIQ